MNLLKLNILLPSLIALCASNVCLADKWLNTDHVTEKPKEISHSLVKQWFSNLSNSVFRDHENHKYTVSQMNSGLASNAKDTMGFELLDRTMNFGSQKSLNSMALSFTEREFRKNNFFKSLQGGVNFKVDLAGGNKPKAEPSPARDTVKYGLVLENIEPSQSQHLLASLPNDRDLQMVDSAPKADLHWSIGRLKPKRTNLRPYQVSLNSPQHGNPSKNWFHGILKPFMSTEISGNIRPHKVETEETPNNLPPQVLSLNQKNGVYSLQLITDDSLKPTTTLHVFNVNLGTATYRSEYNTDWEVQKMSFLNVTEFKNIHANFHHLVLANRYQSELVLRQGSTSWGIKSDTLAEKPMDNIKHDSNKFEISLSKSF